MTNTDSTNDFPFLDYDPTPMRRSATPSPQAAPAAHLPPKPAVKTAAEMTTAELLAFIKRQYRLSEQRQERQDRQRLHERRAAREREPEQSP